MIILHATYHLFDWKFIHTDISHSNLITDLRKCKANSVLVVKPGTVVRPATRAKYEEVIEMDSAILTYRTEYIALCKYFCALFKLDIH